MFPVEISITAHYLFTQEPTQSKSEYTAPPIATAGVFCTARVGEGRALMEFPRGEGPNSITLQGVDKSVCWLNLHYFGTREHTHTAGDALRQAKNL
jgi:hypothetical protein